MQTFEIIHLIIILIGVFVALGIGSYYLWRYINLKQNITLYWAIGFLIVGMGILTKVIIDLTNPSLDSTFDYTKLFQTTSVFILVFMLALSTFFIGLFDKKSNSIGIMLTLLLAAINIIFLSVTSFVYRDIFAINRYITILMSLWSTVFFAYLGIKSKDWRISAVSLGLILSAIGGIFTVQAQGTPLIVIPGIIQLIAYFALGFGLLYPSKSE